jgi:hypothetical protein
MFELLNVGEDEVLALMHFHAAKIKDAELGEDDEKVTSLRRCDRIIELASVLKGNYSDS